MPPRRSVALLALGAVALLAGLTGALALLGITLPPAATGLARSHGLLMTLGFLGTLIALERAVALGRPWGYLAPLAAGIAGLGLVLGLPTVLAGGLLVVAGLAYCGLYLAFDRIERSLHTTIQAVGALAWLGAAILIAAGWPVVVVVPWLAAFLVLTIVGERLELSRLVRPSARARRVFVVIVAAFVAGILASLAAPEIGIRVAGVGLIGLAAWLGRNDVARRTVRTPGVTRFVALALLIGYVWLAVAGMTWLAFGLPGAGAAYDAGLHALFLGFAISMVFGHAPIILPAVLRLALPYHPLFYVHLVLLHAGLVVRVVGGDLVGSDVAWRVGGVLNVVAMLLFLASSAGAALFRRARVGLPGSPGYASVSSSATRRSRNQFAVRRANTWRKPRSTSRPTPPPGGA